MPIQEEFKLGRTQQQLEKEKHKANSKFYTLCNRMAYNNGHSKSCICHKPNVPHTT